MISVISKVICRCLYYSNQASGIIPKNDIRDAWQWLQVSSAEKCYLCSQPSHLIPQVLLPLPTAPRADCHINSTATSHSKGYSPNRREWLKDALVNSYDPLISGNIHKYTFLCTCRFLIFFFKLLFFNELRWATGASMWARLTARCHCCCRAHLK